MEKKCSVLGLEMFNSLAALLLDYSSVRSRTQAAGERLCNTWHGDLLRCLSGEKVGSGRKAGVCFLDKTAFLHLGF